MALRIEDYAMIGDCRSSALVGKDGSIDWLCWPRFDSPACFAALLGSSEHGRWLIAPQGKAKVRRRYRDATLVLETEFECERGSVTLIDFMPTGAGPQSVVRLVVGRRGVVAMRTDLVLRFDSGLTVPWMRHAGRKLWQAIAGPHCVVLRTPVAIRGEDLRSVAEFEVRRGQTVPFTLSYGRSWEAAPAPVGPQRALRKTESGWRRWSRRSGQSGPWTAAVQRSLCTLRGLTYAPTGGIVAAATTSLPEKIGGSRNWDYRYCWLRDATFTLQALMNGGHYDEAAAWRDWLVRAIAGSPEQIQVLYGVSGERALPEREVPWLPGYEGSIPVRIGNAAAEQLQLDLYGELIDMMAQARKGGLPVEPRWSSLRRKLLEHLETAWRQPDRGFWEIRGEPQHFTHSKVMAWVAFHRLAGARIATESAADRARWARLAQAIHDEICAKAYDPRRNCFVQAYGSARLDASLLLLPIVGFLPAQDPRIRGTVAAIEQRLMADGLVLRYETGSGVDGLPTGEGAFLACSFWLADNYVLLGRLADARRLFRRLLRLCNDVGLLAEEYDPRARRQLGNFPQAFSHVALVNTAFNLSRASKPARTRANP
ncbi:MAG: glycoside hydrolase family 15 protein [Nevskia sp.]|nr:glycoside hydrolase family 15 protein [Nevskia sp.]